VTALQIWTECCKASVPLGHLTRELMPEVSSPACSGQSCLPSIEALDASLLRAIIAISVCIAVSPIRKKRAGLDVPVPPRQTETLGELVSRNTKSRIWLGSRPIAKSLRIRNFTGRVGQAAEGTNVTNVPTFTFRSSLTRGNRLANGSGGGHLNYRNSRTNDFNH
jgi:hypothetical protein